MTTAGSVCVQDVTGAKLQASDSNAKSLVGGKPPLNGSQSTPYGSARICCLGTGNFIPGLLRISCKMSTLGFIFEDTASLKVHQPLRRHASRSSDQTDGCL